MLVPVQPQPAVISPCAKAFGIVAAMVKPQTMEAHMTLDRLIRPMVLIYLSIIQLIPYSFKVRKYAISSSRDFKGKRWPTPGVSRRTGGISRLPCEMMALSSASDFA